MVTKEITLVMVLEHPGLLIVRPLQNGIFAGLLKLKQHVTPEPIYLVMLILQETGNPEDIQVTAVIMTHLQYLAPSKHVARQLLPLHLFLVTAALMALLR